MEGQKKMVVGLDRGSGKKIAKALGVTQEMVSKSIRWRKDTELARKIRHVAVTEFGGKEVEY